MAGLQTAVLAVAMIDLLLLGLVMLGVVLRLFGRAPESRAAVQEQEKVAAGRRERSTVGEVVK